MNINKYKEEATLIRNNDTYNVFDLYKLKNLSLSLTELHAHKNTSGHSHSEADEVYVFVSGKGKIDINEDGVENYQNCESGDVFIIPRGAFHKVYNTSDEQLTFWSIFEKYENRK